MASRVVAPTPPEKAEPPPACPGPFLRKSIAPREAAVCLLGHEIMYSRLNCSLLEPPEQPADHSICHLPSKNCVRWDYLARRVVHAPGPPFQFIQLSGFFSVSLSQTSAGAGSRHPAPFGH